MTVLGAALKAAFPDIVEEFQFHPTRKWRADFALKSAKILIEYEGGIYAKKGSHQHLDRYVSDCRKYNAAALLGWTVLRYTAADSLDDIVAQVREALGREK